MSRKFTTFALALLITLGLVNTSRAQATNEDIIRPITKQGSAAFMFTIKGLGEFGIGSAGIAGLSGGVGAKYFLADNLALRVLLGVSNVSDSLSHNPSMFGIGVGIENHFRPLYSTSPYVGAQVGYSSNSFDVSGGTDKTNMFSIGAFAGFDWFFTRGIAAGAEMGLAFTSTGGSVAGTNKATVTSINLATDGAVHLVVYF